MLGFGVSGVAAELKSTTTRAAGWNLRLRFQRLRDKLWPSPLPKAGFRSTLLQNFPFFSSREVENRSQAPATVDTSHRVPCCAPLSRVGDQIMAKSTLRKRTRCSGPNSAAKAYPG